MLFLVPSCLLCSLNAQTTCRVYVIVCLAFVFTVPNRRTWLMYVLDHHGCQKQPRNDFSRNILMLTRFGRSSACNCRPFRLVTFRIVSEWIVWDRIGWGFLCWFLDKKSILLLLTAKLISCFLINDVCISGCFRLEESHKKNQTSRSAEGN